MSTEGVDKSKRRFLTAAATAVGGVGTIFAAVPFVSSMQPSAKTKAAGAPVEVDISKLEEGQRITVEWRGKPVWIVRRSKDMLDGLPGLDAELRDPDSDVESQTPSYAKNTYRSIKPEVLVVIGICTHLGCSPTYLPEPGAVGAEWQGGFFCPCHGGRYDLAGRVFKGVPPPMNLPVPPHQYLSDTLLLIGEDQGVA